MGAGRRDHGREGKGTGSACSLLFFSSVPCVSIQWFVGSIQAAVEKKGVGTCGQEQEERAGTAF